MVHVKKSRSDFLSIADVDDVRRFRNRMLEVHCMYSLTKQERGRPSACMTTKNVNITSINKLIPSRVCVYTFMCVDYTLSQTGYLSSDRV